MTGRARDDITRAARFRHSAVLRQFCGGRHMQSILPFSSSRQLQYMKSNHLVCMCSAPNDNDTAILMVRIRPRTYDTALHCNLRHPTGTFGQSLGSVLQSEVLSITASRGRQEIVEICSLSGHLHCRAILCKLLCHETGAYFSVRFSLRLLHYFRPRTCSPPS
jgi:hypothetical protein